MYVFGNKVKTNTDDKIIGVFSSHNAAYRAFCNLMPNGVKFNLDLIEDQLEFHHMQKTVNSEYDGNVYC